MKVELRCPSCGRGFVADEADSHDAPCPGCGVTLGRAARPEPSLPPAPLAPPAPSETTAAEQPEPSGTAATSAPETAPGVPASPADPAPAEAVVCPRCSLHFTPRAAAAAKIESDRKTILVVEDMDYFLDIVRDALEPNFLVEAAKTVDQARAALIGGEIDLILLDLTLSGGEDGIGLLRGLPFKPCPILIFTAEDESVMYGETWEKLRALGADDVVIKGMNVGESILRKVGSLVGQPIEDDDGGA
jgi:CheY-like chemotaxis protein